MKPMRTLAAAALFLLSQSPPTPSQTVAIRGGRILTMAGPEIEDGLILIENGRITEIGPAREVPWDATVIDAKGRVVMPAFVIAHSQGGVDTANESQENVPFVSVRDSLDASSTYFENCLRDGIGTVMVIPGHRTLIGGTGLVVKPFGRTVAAMTVVDDAGMKISIAAERGSRMSQIQKLRRAFDEILEYLRREKAKAESAPEKEDEPGFLSDLDLDAFEIEPRKGPMSRLLSGKLRAYIWCPDASDVIRANALIEAYRLDATLVVGHGAWKAADALARAGRPVILDQELEAFETDRRTGKEVLRVLPAILHGKGVRFALTTGSGSYGSRYPWYQAAVAVRHGVPRDVALRAVTQVPAEILGLGDRIGTLEKGKDGTLIVLSDDPLSGRAFVERMVIEGVPVYDRSKDAKLRSLLTGEALP